MAAECSGKGEELAEKVVAREKELADEMENIEKQSMKRLINDPPV